MNRNRKVVITTHGHDRIIDKLSVTIFEESDGYYKADSNAAKYCRTINSMELKEGSWAYASIIDENTPFTLDLLLPYDFTGTILTLDDRALQKVFREFDSDTLMKAFKGSKDEILEKVYKNMSERRVKMFKEDSEYMGPIRLADVEEAQKKMLSVVRHLEDTGEIVIARSGEDELVI